MSVDLNQYKFLGYANDWAFKPKPEEAKNCNHATESQNIGRCLTRYICHECKIYYNVDSSD